MTKSKSLELVTKNARSRTYRTKIKDEVDLLVIHEEISDKLAESGGSAGYSASRAWVEYGSWAGQTKIVVQVEARRLAVETEEKPLDIYIQLGEETFDHDIARMRMGHVERVVADFFDQYDTIHKKEGEK